ncbi:hypothetical protein BCR35DRAFT_305165 [Leucosporidium creatinivorum]|uniref:C2H2-type domain-containing protein n=1 Tax=Leucosporidium creatinivorum TaxID=106004 RepID=A0A1Y2F3W8_9BASI|nr:hypothetical protein BCR35DRAFT_305165 [Leucosporidium creatinivorum]
MAESAPNAHACRWRFCTNEYATVDELKSHLFTQHVQEAQPLASQVVESLYPDLKPSNDQTSAAVPSSSFSEAEPSTVYSTAPGV